MSKKGYIVLMASPMSTPYGDGEVPTDTFGGRLALIRAEKGWNVTQAARACGLDRQSWTNWERSKTHPQDMTATARQVSDATGYSFQWLMAGGPLNSRCNSGLSLLSAPIGQMELALDATTEPLTLASR